MILSRFPVHAALATAVLLFVSTPNRSHAAPGVNLAWNHCLGEGTGVQNLDFACDTNTGSRTIVASMILPSDLPQATGILVHVRFTSASATLPAWWELRGSSSCRTGALNVNMIADPANAVCADWSDGTAAGGQVGYCSTVNPTCGVPPPANGAVLTASTFVSLDVPKALTAGTEYFLFNFVINNLKTVGPGSCAGCEIPVCIVFNDAYVDDVSGLKFILVDPTAPGTNSVAWQGGGGGATGCPGVTPTRRSTWASVKSLYR